MADEDDPNRALILARRNRLIAAAIIGATTVTSATACACLSPISDAGPEESDAGSDAGPSDSGEPDAS
jgi:hypothetical protein